MLILLPPSEGKTPARRGKPLDLARSRSLSSRRPGRPCSTRWSTCAAATRTRPAATLGLPPGLADLVGRNADLPAAPTARADRVYTGVLYDALDLPDLPADARRRATSRVAVVSSLFGLVRPGDRIPAYRLSGDASLPGLGPVAASGARTSTPWSARPRAPGWSSTSAPRRTPRSGGRRPTSHGGWSPCGCCTSPTGRRTVVSHFNKATKGRLVRGLLEDGANPGSVPALVRTLERLGWQVEVGGAAAHGTPIDVVVAEV